MATLTGTTTRENEDISLSTIRLKSIRHASKGSQVARSSDVGLPVLARSSSNGDWSGSADVSFHSATSQNRGNSDEDNSKIQRRKNIQFATLCFNLFLAGYNDGTTGPLLPTIQSNYQVNFTIVSLIFVFSCIGFISGALLNVHLTNRLGFGKTIALGALCQLAAYIMLAPAPPFPVFVIAYIVIGFSIALQDAQANGFVAASADRSRMNFLHAAYGFGALVSPLIATQFSQIKQWSFHYLTSLGLAIINLAFLIAVFKLKTQDALLTKNGHPAAEVTTSHQSTMRQMMGLPTVHLLSFFALVYVGVEVTIGGWIVTFIIKDRKGGANSGYISTGFWGGLTAGRLVLHYLSRFIPDRYSIYLYSIICIGLEITIWFTPSLIGNAVAVCFIGFFLGPMYPSIMNQSSGIIPRALLTGSIGWIAGFGQAGSAFLPFITGVLANKFGINSLQPLIVAAIVVMMILWALVPYGQRRLD